MSLVTPLRALRDRLDRGKELAKSVVLSVITPKLPLPAEVADWRVILVGASVGRSWRLQLVFPGVETLCAPQFDKTAVVADAIARRPDAIIIKECAAYFPDDGVDTALVERWVVQLREAGIAPILATVVPVTRAHAAAVRGRAEALWRFNDWLSDYARREGVVLLDLEQALRISDSERYLRDGLDTGDGMHLLRHTYREHLDQLIPQVLLTAHRAASSA